ncbi:MAG: sigma-E factor negative regulatory protein [Gammaproteobacteria bacterium]|nr:sigma-E factor negative regulatory protein [Gammaproteobacteria bacterium]
MSEKLKGSLSAIIDGEADEFELRRVLDEIDKNEELRRTWERYHLIGSRLRGERIDSPAKLSQRVWDALDFAAEDDVSLPSRDVAMREGQRNRATPRFGRWTGIAVAATVAVAVVLGFNTFDAPVGGTGAVVVVDEGLVVEAPVVELTPVGTALDIQRQNAWMMRHAQLMGMNQQGFTSFIKMATYERQ